MEQEDKNVDASTLEKYITKHLNVNDLLGRDSSSDSESFLGIAFGKKELDQELEQLQKQIFGVTNYVNKEKDIKKTSYNTDHRIQGPRIEDRLIKEENDKIKAFQFDLGYLDAEVSDLLALLDSLYPDTYPMPDTISTKSIYATKKDNFDKLDLKVILNRLCLICKYKIPDKKKVRTSEDWEVSEEVKSLQDTFIEEFKRIRMRTASVFKKELGDISGCLLSYPDYFILMMEGPEISIMDVLHQGKKLFFEYIIDGVVLFISDQVIMRFFQEWLDMKIEPLPNPSTIREEETRNKEDLEYHKEKLLLLSERCKTLWKILAANQRSGSEFSTNYSLEIFPDIKLLEFALKSELLRKFDSWLQSVTTQIFSDYTETWPQVNYSLPLTAHKSDTQFDSMGVIDKYEDLPEIEQQLDSFLKSKPSWKPREFIDSSDISKIINRAN